MPFIEQWRRDKIDRLGIESLATIHPGDRCYIFYKQLVDEWNKEPRWATAHRLHKEAIEWTAARDYDTDRDDIVAYWLAWQVFFQLHVMPYELEKQKKNGDI